MGERMPSDKPEPSSLGAQRQHWEQTFAARPEMFGREPSDPARAAATTFKNAGLKRILELGGGQGRDSAFFAASGFEVHVLDYAQAGVSAIRESAKAAGVTELLTVAQHDVREPLPAGDSSFDACYSHMLFCMALTTKELVELAKEIHRVLRPGGMCVYTVRNTTDPDFGRGIHRGEGMYENQGFIVHFFDRAMVELLANGYELLDVGEFEEAKLPRRLYRVTLRKPAK